MHLESKKCSPNHRAVVQKFQVYNREQRKKTEDLRAEKVYSQTPRNGLSRIKNL